MSLRLLPAALLLLGAPAAQAGPTAVAPPTAGPGGWAALPGPQLNDAVYVLNSQVDGKLYASGPFTDCT